MEPENKLKFSLNVAVISGIFCVTVALLLLLNFIQMAKNKPLESKALVSLVQRLAKEPNSDELKQEIRNFDLLARKRTLTVNGRSKPEDTCCCLEQYCLPFRCAIF